jgi:hypothetical protein
VDPEPLSSLSDELITEEMNGDLCKEFIDEEISDALFQIGPLKAPGPDGFPAHFFQRNWPTLKVDVTRAVWRFFESGRMPDGVNEMAIVLLPKMEAPDCLEDFRPISLCNVIYRVVSKCLVSRMQPLLNDLIGPMQSAFLPR